MNRGWQTSKRPEGRPLGGYARAGQSPPQPLAAQTSSGKASPLQPALPRPAGRRLPALGRPAPSSSPAASPRRRLPPRAAEQRGAGSGQPRGAALARPHWRPPPPPGPARDLPRRDGPPPDQPGLGPAPATPPPAALRAALPAAALAVPRAVLPRQARLTPSFPPSLACAAGSVAVYPCK